MVECSILFDIHWLRSATPYCAMNSHEYMLGYRLGRDSMGGKSKLVGDTRWHDHVQRRGRKRKPRYLSSL